MSDITKKIHSIEPETNLPEGRIKLKPLPEAPVERDVPDFVKRRNDLNPTLYKPSNTGQVFLWAGVLLASAWLVLGVALLFTRGIDVVQSWGIFEYLLVGVVIVLPALLILFLAITLKRLSQTSADALRLSDISAQLLKVDEHAAESVTSLAGAIRSSLNALDGDMVRLNTNLAHMKDESAIHATKLNEATDYALKSSETVAQNFAAQKESLSTAHHSLAETLTQLNTEFESKTTVISKLSEQTQTVTEKSAETVDAKLSLMSDKVKEIAAKDAEASENLAVFDEKASRTIQEMEGKIQQLEAVTQKLKTENETFEKLLGKRSEELAQISKLNDVTDSTFVDFINRGKTLSSDLQNITSSADQTLAAHLVAFKNEVADSQKLSNKALDTLDSTATEIFERYKTKAYSLEEKIETLRKSVENLETRFEQQAETKALELKMPSQREPIERSTPMGLRPLKSNISEPHADDFVADTQISFEASLTEDDLSKNILAENIEEPVSSAVETPSPRKSLFGSSPKVSEPLELDEDAIIMPNPDVDIDKEDPFTLQVLDEDQDLLKPLSDNSSSIFGRKKETPKPKAQWRWRDMLGGFDSREDIAKEIPQSQAAPLDETSFTPDTTNTPPSSKRPFENMIEMMGIDPERAISDQLISEMATTFVTDDALIKIIAVNGLPELSKYIKEHSQYGQSYQNSAAHYEAQFLKNINPEIMNKEAIHSSLSTEAGRHFIIALLG